MKDGPIRVVIADDHMIFRTGLRNILQLETKLQITGEATNGKELIELTRQLKPDVILTDIVMPEMTGIEATRLLCKEMPGTKIIALTMFNEGQMLVDMLDAGAMGYILKNTQRKEIVNAINTVLVNKPYFANEVADHLAQIVNNPQKELMPMISPDIFTAREQEIMCLICGEHTTKEIAKKLKLSTRTVDNHRLRIMEKLGAKSIAGVIAYTIRSGICQQ